jgi:hypothetical protein
MTIDRVQREFDRRLRAMKRDCLITTALAFAAGCLLGSLVFRIYYHVLRKGRTRPSTADGLAVLMMSAHTTE